MGWWAMNSLRDLCGRVMSSQDLPDAAARCRVLRIAFSSPEQVRSRRVVTRSRFRPTGKYPSWKMERMLQWESLNELNAFRLLDCDPRVAVFTEQPCEIVYIDGTETRRHYPDIYVEIDGNQELWEVKAECEGSQSVTISFPTERFSAFVFSPDSRFGNWRVLGYPLPPPPVPENKGFAARLAVKSCKHLSYMQSTVNTGVRQDFLGRGGGVGWQMGETSSRSRTDHRSNHLLGIRVKVWPPSTWTTALPHPSVDKCRHRGAQQQGRRSRTHVIRATRRREDQRAQTSLAPRGDGISPTFAKVRHCTPPAGCRAASFLIGSECGYSLHDPEHRHGADGVGRHELEDR